MIQIECTSKENENKNASGGTCEGAPVGRFPHCGFGFVLIDVEFEFSEPTIRNNAAPHPQCIGDPMFNQCFEVTA